MTNNFLELCQLEEEIFGASAYSPEEIHEMLNDENKNYKFFFAYDDSKIVAYLIVFDSLDFYEVMKIGTEKNYRKKGYAKKLLLDFLKTSDKNVMLEVRVTNNIAQDFYEKCGFKKINIRKNYYQNNGEDAVVMEYKNFEL
ncbi:MAG: ribosomal protein S18-alanine N-acetyltransferase [Fusobacteriaceae bacterium]